MTRKALDLLCDRLPAVARELDVSLDTLRSYRTRRRSPSPATARALALLLRRRARALTALARRLDALGEEGKD
jgi:DNA-binding transcriptional regulator YiaG